MTVSTRSSLTNYNGLPNTLCFVFIEQNLFQIHFTNKDNF